MRIILIVLLSLLVLNSKKQPDQFGPQDAYNLVKGLLTGLEFPDVDVLMKWMNNIPDIYNDIIQIIDLLKHIDIKHIINLI